jgi:hypothetical protein
MSHDYRVPLRSSGFINLQHANNTAVNSLDRHTEDRRGSISRGLVRTATYICLTASIANDFNIIVPAAESWIRVRIDNVNRFPCYGNRTGNPLHNAVADY